MKVKTATRFTGFLTWLSEHSFESYIQLKHGREVFSNLFSFKRNHTLNFNSGKKCITQYKDGFQQQRLTYLLIVLHDFTLYKGGQNEKMKGQTDQTCSTYSVVKMKYKNFKNIFK